jgi:hypothetical protein
MFDWSRFFVSFTEAYYTVLIMFVVELIALVIAIIYGRRSKIGRVFIFYIAFDFSILIAGNILAGIPGISSRNYSLFINYADLIIELVELSVYYYLFYYILPNKKIRIALISLALLYGVFVIIYLFNGLTFFPNRHIYIANVLSVFAFIFLLPFCLLYFHYLLSNTSNIGLFERPSFWVVTGIFFYAFISIPFYLLDSYIKKSSPELLHILAAIFFYVPFTLNFVFLIRAFLCKKPLTI